MIEKMKCFYKGKEYTSEWFILNGMNPDSVSYCFDIIHNGVIIPRDTIICAPWNGIFEFGPEWIPGIYYWIDGVNMSKDEYRVRTTKLGKVFY